MSVYLRTDNFVLRNLKNGDEEDLLFLLNDSELKKHIPGLSLGGMHQLILLSNLNRSLLLVIEDFYLKKVIGMIYAYIDINGDSSSIHYVTHPNYRGKGIMPEALKHLIRYLYEQKLACNVNFSIKSNLKSSLRVMEKLNISLFEQLDNEYIFKLSLKEELPF